MGTLSLAAKITHVPSMYLSELDGPHKGCRQAAIDGHVEIGERCRRLGVDTIVVFDVHWLVNSEYHVNCAPEFQGVYTSNELPHFIRNMPYAYPGNPALGKLVAEAANAAGIAARAHDETTLELEYGTLVPMRYMNADRDLKVVSVSAWCTVHSHAASRKIGAAIRKGIEESDSKVALIASGSLSHKIWPNDIYAQNNGTFTISSEFNRQVDLLVLDLWKRGEIATFLKMLPDYAEYCDGEGDMHDTVMLFGALGWDEYKGRGELVGDYFPSSGTGQANVVFSLDN